MTQALAHPYPSSAQLTFEDYRFYESPSGVCYELFRGQLIPMNPPTPLHVNICQFLVYQIQQYLAEQDALNLVVKSETGVRTEDTSSRIPDVTVCSRETWQTLCDRAGSGILDFTQGEIPRLVIEVVSENWKDDYVRKRAEYAFIGIAEYWIVDYRRQHVWVLTNPDSLSIYEQTQYVPGENLKSVEFEGLALAVSDVLNPPFVEDLMRQGKVRADRMAAKLRELGLDPGMV